MILQQRGRGDIGSTFGNSCCSKQCFTSICATLVKDPSFLPLCYETITMVGGEGRSCHDHHQQMDHPCGLIQLVHCCSTFGCLCKILTTKGVFVHRQPMLTKTHWGVDMCRPLNSHERGQKLVCHSTFN